MALSQGPSSLLVLYNQIEDESEGPSTGRVPSSPAFFFGPESD